MGLVESQEMLNIIYQNLVIALQSIDNILPISKGKDIEQELAREYNEYSVFLKEAEMLATAEDFDLKENVIFDKLKLWTSFKLSNFTDKSQSNVCEMIIMGSTVELVDLIKTNTKFKFVDIDIRELINNLIQFVRNNLEMLYQYL